MRSSKYKQVLLCCVAGIGTTLFPSCVVSDAYMGANTGIGRTSSILPVGLIRTSNANWFYDPYCRSYYNVSQRAYFNNAANRYYTTTPRRFNNRVFPSSWNGRGTFPAPAVASRSIFRQSQSSYPQTRTARTRVSHNHPHIQRADRTTTQSRSNQGRVIRDSRQTDSHSGSTRVIRSDNNYHKRSIAVSSATERGSLNSSRSSMRNESPRSGMFGGRGMSNREQQR